LFSSPFLITAATATSSAEKLFYAATWETEYKKAYIDAKTEQEARNIAHGKGP
jgi:hypothetical protein